MGITSYNSICLFLFYGSIVFSIYWMISFLFTLNDPIGRVLYTIYRFMQYYTEVIIYKAEHIIENV